MVIGSIVFSVGLQTRRNASSPPVHADTIAAAVDEHSPWASNSNQLAHPSRGELLKLLVPSVWSLPCRGRRTARALTSSAAPCRCVLAELVESRNSTNQIDKSVRQGSLML
jgi:hypothetical protein